MLFVLLSSDAIIMTLFITSQLNFHLYFGNIDLTSHKREISSPRLKQKRRTFQFVISLYQLVHCHIFHNLLH